MESPALPNRWLLKQASLLALIALILLAVFHSGRVDLWVEALSYDPQIRDFPMRHVWFFNEILHHGMKTASTVCAVVMILLCLLAMRRNWSWLPRRNAMLAALGMVLIPSVTSLLKLISNRHCPWDVIEFGGYAPYIALFDPLPAGMHAGACFPAGHASAGFLWMIWALALRQRHPGMARAALIGGLFLGAAMGFGRQAQGAHFLSHTLWSAWIAWAIGIALAAVLLRQKIGAGGTAQAVPSKVLIP